MLVPKLPMVTKLRNVSISVQAIAKKNKVDLLSTN